MFFDGLIFQRETFSGYSGTASFYSFRLSANVADAWLPGSSRRAFRFSARLAENPIFFALSAFAARTRKKS
jgi:hypothetical protein